MPLAGSDPKRGPSGASALCPPQHPQGLAVRATLAPVSEEPGRTYGAGEEEASGQAYGHWVGLTDGTEGMLELQGEGGEGHILRHGHDGHRREVAGGDPRVPLATCRV